MSLKVPKLTPVPNDNGQPADLSGNLYSEQFAAGDGPPVPGPVSSSPSRPDMDGDKPPVSYSDLQKTYENVAQADPDHAAKVIGFARRLNEPESFVDKNLPALEKQSEQPPPGFFQGIDSEHPKVADWLMDPKNMVISHDDLHNMVAQAGLIKQHHEATNFLDSIKAGWQGSSLGLDQLGHMPDETMSPDAPWYNRFAATAVGLAGDAPEMIAGAAVGGAAGASTGATIGGLATAWTGPGALAGVAGGGLFGGILGGGYGAMAAPAMVKKALMLKYQEGDVRGFSDLLNRAEEIAGAGVRPGLLGAAAGLAGPIAGSIAGPLAGKVGGPLAQKIATPVASVGAEVGTFSEGSAAMEGRPATAQDYLDNLLLVGAMHGTGALGKAHIENYVEAKQAERAKGFFVALGDTVEASKARARLPEAQRSFIDKLTADGPVENLFIPHEKFVEYFQGQKMDPAAVASELGVTQSYSEATLGGGDVKIPLADWTEKVGHEHYAGLADDIRFNPDDLTNREAVARSEEIQKAVTEAQSKAEGAPPESSGSGDEVKQHVFKVLTDAGMDAKEAAANAVIYKHKYENRARLRNKGESAMDLFKAEGPEIRNQGSGEAPTADGASYDQNQQPLYGKFEVRDDMPKEMNKVIVSPEDEKIARNSSVAREMQRAASAMGDDKAVVNEHTGLKIEFGNVGLNKSMRGENSLANRLAVGNIKELMKHAVLDGEETPYKEKAHVEKYLRFYAPMESGGVEYLVRMKVEKQKNGNYFYHEIAVESERPSGNVQQSSPEGESSMADTGSSKTSIHDFADHINETRKSRTWFQSSKMEQGKPSPIAEQLKESLGKDLNIDVTEGGEYQRYHESPYDAGTNIDGKRKKAAEKMGFDTDHAWYHGTRANIESFSGDTLGESTGAGSSKLAHFFASSPDTASDYADASDDALTLRSTKTEGEATRARADFNERMKEKHGSSWVSKMSDAERTERAQINQQFKRAGEDFARSQEATTHKVDRLKYDIGEQERNIKFMEKQLETGAVEKDNASMSKSLEFAKKKAAAEWVGNGSAYNLIDKETGEKMINPALKDKEGDSPYRFYDHPDRNNESIARLEQRISENTEKNLKAELKEAKSALGEMNDHLLRVLEGTEGQVVYPTVLKMKNPLTVDFKGMEYREVTYREILEKAKEAGHDGVIFKNTYDPAFVGSMARDADLMDVAAVFDPSQIRSVSAKFDPKKAESANLLHQPGDASEAPRGRIRIGEDRRSIIDLMQHKDHSTLIHESGHLWLNDLITDATTEGVDPQLPKDLDTILEWLGHESRAKDGADAIRKEMTVDQHEQFARGMEAYVMEGKSPSEALRVVFQKFGRWLTKIYKDIKNLNVVLNPDVKAVMDRMLATQDEIAEAAQKIGYEDGLAQELSPEAGRRIRTLQERARDQATETLMREQMKELTESHKQFLTDERARLQTEAEAQVKEMPLYKATEAIQEEIGPRRKAYDLASKMVEGKIKAEDAAHFEVAAEQHGFTDGKELANQIVSEAANDGFKKEVDARVAEGMKQHADLKDTEKIKAAAMKAIHSEHSTELLALEHRALSDLIGQKDISAEIPKRKRAEARIDAKAATEQARAILEAKPVKDAGQARTYITAERNAAIKVAKAIGKKDFEAAAAAKQQQMLNHALAAEAMRNRTETTKILGQLSDMANRGRDLKDMPYGFTRQVDQVMQKFGMGQPKPEDTAALTKIADQMAGESKDPSEIANATGLVKDDGGKWALENLQQFMTRVNDNYRGMMLPDSVLTGGAKDFKDLTLGQLRDVNDAVKEIAHVGKTLDRYLEAYRTMDIREAASQFAASVVEHFGTPEAKNLEAGSQHATKFQEWLAALGDIPSKFDRVLDTILTTCEKFDGRNADGPAKNNIYRPLAEAQNREMARVSKMMKEADGIFADHYDMKDFATYKDTKVKVGEKYWTKEQILSMALNWGNATNKDRLMKWLKTDAAGMQEYFQHLDKKDWDFAQATWKHINDSYWADSLRLEHEVNGVEPKKVQAEAFTNEHGTYEGGYYPLAYDYDKSTEAFTNKQASTALFQSTSTARAMTEQGHLKERVSNLTRPMRLSLDALIGHHENMIHDLEFRRAVIDVNRFIHQTDSKAAIMNAVGVRGFKAVEDWVKSVARNPSEPLSMGEQAARWLRFKTTFYNLGYRLVSAPKIAIENVANVSSELGVSGAARAVKDYYFGDGNAHEMIVDKSEFMKQRANHLDRDLADISKKWQGTGQSNYQRFAFFVHSFLDQGMSGPLWLDAYKGGMAEHGNEKLAITQGDEAVKRTFMTGGGIDQSAVMRGPEKTKLLTTAFGYSSMMWNRFSLQRHDVTQAIRAGNNLDAAAIAARSFVYTFAMPAVIAAVTREMLHNSKGSSKEDREKRMAAALLEEGTPLKFIPVARDLAPYLIKKSMGERVGNLQVTPLEGAAQVLMDPMADVFHAAFSHDHHLDQRFPERAAGAASLMFGVPKQANDIAFNFIDWQKEHGELTWRDFVTRRQKK